MSRCWRRPVDQGGPCAHKPTPNTVVVRRNFPEIVCMTRICLLALLLSAAFCLPAQTIVPPYNPDVDQDSAIGAGDLLGLLPLFGNYFTPSEVTVDGQTLTEYIAALEEAAGNATSDTVTIPMLSGTAPGQMLYWNGAEWTLVPTGQPGDALLLEGTTPTWTSADPRIVGHRARDGLYRCDGLQLHRRHGRGRQLPVLGRLRCVRRSGTGAGMRLRPPSRGRL